MSAPSDKITEKPLTAEQAYMRGVEEIASKPVIYVDPDNLSGNIDSMIEQLAEQLESQVSGATSSIIERLINLNNGNIADPTMLDILSLRDFANTVKNGGPFSLNGIFIDGQEHCVINKPSYFLDSKEEIVRTFLGGRYDEQTTKAIIANIPGTDSDWLRLGGNHEGEHCQNKKDTYTKYEMLGEEVAADNTSLNKSLEQGKSDLALALKDLRYLSNNAKYPGHATGPLINSDDKASAIHIVVAEIYRFKMGKEVNENFNWDSYKGEATDAKELLKENPDAYFEHIQKALDGTKTRIMEQYNKAPTEDNLHAVITTQIFTNYMNGWEDAYRRRALGQDIPERMPAQFISQEIESDFYDRLEKEYESAIRANNDDKVSYKQGIDGTPYTALVEGISGGEPKVDFEKGITVGGKAIPEAFAQIANPAPEDIRVVNAKMTPPENQIMPPVPTANNPEYNTQTYG